MNTNLHPFTARYNGLKSFLKEYSKKELTKRLFVAGTTVYKPNLDLPSPASVLRIVDLVYS